MFDGQYFVETTMQCFKITSVSIVHVHSEIVRSFFSIGIKFGYEGFLCQILYE